MFSIRLVAVTAVLVISALSTGCGGDGSSGPGGGDSTVTLSGTVSAPGGQIAFNRPTGLHRLLASILGSPAYGAIQGVLPVGAGVTVSLIEVDAGGQQVGATLATATTAADGSFQLQAPAGFVPASRYVIRAEGTSQSLDARVVGATCDVDPLSHAVSTLVTDTASDLSTIAVDELNTITDAVDSVSQQVDPTGLDAAGLAAQLTQATVEDEEASNVVSSTAAAGAICGTVTDNTGTAVKGVRIVVRDFGNWVTRAKTLTDDAGHYCVNVPDGVNAHYIVGAINRTAASMGASEWWSAGGHAYSQIDADKVSVPDTTPLTRDFSLEAGARIQGHVLAGSGGVLAAGAPLTGVKVLLRDYGTYFPTAAGFVKTDGSYRINVIPGNYAVMARNQTRRPYATKLYDGAAGTNDRGASKPLVTSAGQTYMVDFSLEPGHRLVGTVLDGPGGSAVGGTLVRLDVTGGGPAVRLRTNKVGKYRIWLKPGSYDVDGYGQTATVDLSAADQTLQFSQAVGTVTAVIKDGSGNPVSQGKCILWDPNNSYGFVNLETSNSDGTVTLYSTVTGNHVLSIRIDDARSYGSSVYDNKTQMLNGTLVSLVPGSNTDLGTVTLPSPAGLLAGRVYQSDGVTPVGNVKVQVRSGGLTGAQRFITMQTLGDGSYSMSLPAATYDRVVAIGPASNKYFDAVTVNAGATTTRDFILP